MSLSLFACSLAVWTASGAQASQSASVGEIVRSCFDASCTHWNDTDGNRIEAHSAGFLRAGSGADARWYWYGESKKTGNLSEHGVTCYSSASLAGPWKFEGQVVSQNDIEVPGRSGPWVVERPKVLYNEKTKKYVMWFHLDESGYKFRHTGVATADSPEGPFTFLYGFQPDGIPALDMNLYQDTDGQAYFVRSCDNQYLGISRLSSDYLNSTGVINKCDRREGMALFRLPNGTLYMITSHLTGWNPNPLALYRAAGATLDDPQWVDMGNPTGSATSFNSQPTFVVQVTDDQGKSYPIYMADNWVHGGPEGLIDAAYIWLPIEFDGNQVKIEERAQWDLAKPF